MARRTTNLFELLQTRRGDAPPSHGMRGEPPATWFERLKAWWGERSGRTERRGRHGPNRIRVEHQILRYSLSAPALAMLAVCTLGLGFGLGWWAGGQRGSAALESSSRTALGQVPAAGPGAGPGPLSDPSAAEPSTLGWPAARQFERVSNWAVPLLSFSASREAAAIRLAAYLRDQGLQDARVLRYEQPEGGVGYLTLCYVPEGQGDTAKAARAAIVSRLKSLPEPAFEPRFAAKVAGLDPEGSFYELQPHR